MDCNYTLNLFSFNKIQNRFLCVYRYRFGHQLRWGNAGEPTINHHSNCDPKLLWNKPNGWSFFMETALYAIPTWNPRCMLFLPGKLKYWCTSVRYPPRILIIFSWIFFYVSPDFETGLKRIIENSDFFMKVQILRLV